MRSGKVYLVGAGPGDIGLVTLKAVDLLKAADVVVYDQLVNPEILAFARQGAELVFAGKYAGDHVLGQAEINQVLIDRAHQGKAVVRLKGGDPLLFGRGAEEALELAEAGVLFEIVPGVSSAYAVPAYAGIPVTYRNISSRLNIVTGHETPDKGKAVIPWKKLLDKNGTLVILMGFGNLETIVRQIVTTPEALKTPVALISRGTRPEQLVVTGVLSNIVKKVKASGMKAPAIIVIGAVVNLRKKLDWFKPELPLKGKRILVTRPVHQASVLADLLKRQGASVTAIPLITVVASRDVAGIRSTLHDLDQYDWIVLTSVNGAVFFLKALGRHKISLDRLKGKKFAAIGKKTAEHLEAAGIKVDLTPREFVQEGLADAMIQAIATGSRRVLLPHAAGSRTVLEQRLRAAGLKVDTLDLYSTRPVTENHRRVKKLFEDRKVDAVMLTSSSCAESFIDVFDRSRLKQAVGDVVMASIGPITSATIRKAGLAVAVESQESTIEGVTHALVGYYRQSKKDAT